MELATAVAGRSSASIRSTSRMSRREGEDTGADGCLREEGTLPPKSQCTQNGVALYIDERNAQALRQAGDNSTLEAGCGAQFGRLHDGDYFAVLAYLERSEAHNRMLQELRRAVRDSKRVATACIRPALFSLDRPGLQGRAEQRRVPPDHRGCRARSDYSGPQGQFRRGRGGAGERRYSRAGGTRPARATRARRRTISMPASLRSARRRGRRCDEVGGCRSA